MTVGELVDKLNKFDPKMEVLITDGYNFYFYRGEYLVSEFNDNDVTFVDIGIGGCLEETDETDEID